MKQYIASALFQLKEATKYTQAGSSDNNSFSRHFSATISNTSCKKPPGVPSPKTGKLRRDSGCRSARRSLGTRFSGLRKLNYLLSCICCCWWLRGRKSLFTNPCWIARFVELLISFATLSVIALMDILFTYLKSTLLQSTLRQLLSVTCHESIIKLIFRPLFKSQVNALLCLCLLLFNLYLM